MYDFKVTKKQRIYTDKQGVERIAYNFFLVHENGVRIPIEPKCFTDKTTGFTNYKSKMLLTAFAKPED